MSNTARCTSRFSCFPAFIALSASASTLWGDTANQSVPAVEWVRQVGSTNFDESLDVSADKFGNVYIAGRTGGNWGGAHSGNQDVSVSKFDSAGSVLWTRQLGVSGGHLWCNGVSADGLGNVYIAGHAPSGSLGTQFGGQDAYVAKYDGSGNLLWTRQFGTADGEFGLGISADANGNAYVTGYTEGNLQGTNAGGRDAYLTKYDPNGNLLWIRQFGTTEFDEGSNVSIDPMGNAFVSGHTTGRLGSASFGNNDAFVSKIDPSGALIWTQQLGTSQQDESYGVSADNLGNVYISGFTAGNLAGTSSGPTDAFLAKYDASGNHAWTRQLGTAAVERSNGVAANDLGDVYISGFTRGNLDGASAGQDDAFVSKYDAAGNFYWTYQFGTSEDDASHGLSADIYGHVYVTGLTEGNLVTPNPGGGDAFLLKIQVPEPTTLALACLSAIFAMMYAPNRDRRFESKSSRRSDFSC